ncbi:MAG: hypothetical protein HY821_13165 [Acidobacteria bacterium]|nr:hypothetical protein [Acidobacteriota bacterium]
MQDTKEQLIAMPSKASKVDSLIETLGYRLDHLRLLEDQVSLISTDMEGVIDELRAIRGITPGPKAY